MAKKKIIRKSNRPLTFRVPNYYDWGGDFKAAWGSNPFDLKGTFSGGNFANMLKGGLASGLGSAVGNLAGTAISGGLESGAGSAISGIGSTIGGAISMVNPLLGGIVSAGSGILSGVANALFGSDINQEKVNEIETSNRGLNTLMVSDGNNDSILSQWSSQDFGENFNQSDVGRDGLFSNKAKKKYESLKTQQDIARNRALTAFDNAIDSTDMQNDLNALTNFAAYGGPISVLAKGGKIHIKKANRGKFTDYCGGKVTSECIARGKRSKSAAVRKRAVFAQNARKFKHAYGGFLEGMEYDLDESTIKDLISKGYEIEYL